MFEVKAENISSDTIESLESSIQSGREKREVTPSAHRPLISVLKKVKLTNAVDDEITGEIQSPSLSIGTSIAEGQVEFVDGEEICRSGQKLRRRACRWAQCAAWIVALTFPTFFLSTS